MNQLVPISSPALPALAAAASARASAGSSTGICPEVTMCRGPRSVCAGLIGTIWHNLDEYLVAYLDGAGLRDDPRGPLFRTIGRGTGQLTRTALPQANAYVMIRRRAAAGRDRDQARQSQLPRDRHHCLSQEWRHPGKGRGDGEPCINAHDAALRSPPR